MIIGLVGKRDSGKTTVANILKERGFVEFSFAETVKEIVKIVFGFDYSMLLGDTPEKRELRKTIRDPFWNKTPIEAMQFIGTDLFRKHFDEDVWIRILERRIKESENKNIVISDARYLNEIEFIRNHLKGQIIVLYNDERDLEPMLTTETHSSECSFQGNVNSSHGDNFIHNLRGPENWREQLATKIDSIIQPI